MSADLIKVSVPIQLKTGYVGLCLVICYGWLATAKLVLIVNIKNCEILISTLWLNYISVARFRRSDLL